MRVSVVVAKYLLDSDVLIWVFRNCVNTVALLEQLQKESTDPLACSAMSVLEVWVGTKPMEREKTVSFFSALKILAVDAAIAQGAANLIRLRKRSDPREWIDAVIAATALQFDMTLVTYNRRDYPYPEISLYPS